MRRAAIAYPPALRTPYDTTTKSTQSSHSSQSTATADRQVDRGDRGDWEDLPIQAGETVSVLAPSGWGLRGTSFPRAPAAGAGTGTVVRSLHRRRHAPRFRDTSPRLSRHPGTATPTAGPARSPVPSSAATLRRRFGGPDVMRPLRILPQLDLQLAPAAMEP